MQPAQQIQQNSCYHAFSFAGDAETTRKPSASNYSETVTIMCLRTAELGLLFAGRAPDSPSQWETWYAAIGKVMACQAITGTSTGRTKHRLVHAYCARRHPDDESSDTEQQTAHT